MGYASDIPKELFASLAGWKARLLPVPIRKTVVIRFSGYNTDKNINSHHGTLLKYIADPHLSTLGTPTAAFYKTLCSLLFLIRNDFVV